MMEQDTCPDCTLHLSGCQSPAVMTPAPPRTARVPGLPAPSQYPDVDWVNNFNKGLKDRSERNKPDCRSSGQGPLSSIRAAIKRSSRTSSHSEQQRDRRRPEITIVAAEPLRPSSWFPGASPVAPQGLGFSSASPHAQWRTNELIPAELPPSYEQVIKEINQVQVNTTNNNNAAAPRHTTSSATQTDFPQELISCLPGSNEKSSVPTHGESTNYPVGPGLLKPPRPSAPLLNRSSENETSLLVNENSEDQRHQENPNAVICPVPKPRSRSNLRPVVKNTQSQIGDNGEEVNQSDTKRLQLSVQQSSVLDDSLLDNHLTVDSMSTGKSQSSIVSRIKVFETQGANDTSGLLKKPEIAPRTFTTRPVPAKKPVVAPKPGVDRVSGEWDAWTESKPIPSSRELQLQPEAVGSSVVTKPELPKKPKPGLEKSSSSDFLDAKSGSVAENSHEQRKFPVPAPRPLIPKKSHSAENPALSLVPLKPISAPPRTSVSAQEKVFKSVGELSPTENSSAPASQSKLDLGGDLISFDDDVLPLSPSCAVKDSISCEAAADPFQFLPKIEPAKEQAAQPAVARKPTVIRIPAKPGKSLDEIPHSPPPLPAEKPIGNTADIAVGKPNSGDLVKNMDLSNSEQAGASQLEPALPPRPVDGKIIPARPPPPKGVPGRPPPPKLSATKTSSQKDALSRSTSYVAYDKKPSKLRLGPKRTKSQVIKKQDPALPPRPRPGHPLYNKYVLSVPRGVAKENCLPRNRGELSRKDSNSSPKVSDTSAPHAVALHDFSAEHADDLDLRSGDTVYLLERVDAKWYRGKCGNRTGIFPASFVQVIVDIPEDGKRKKIPCSSQSIKGPRCVARFEYIGDERDELSFSEGETIILKEYINEEWAKGELRGASGIFPLNFVEVIEDLPEKGTGGALKKKAEVSSPLLQNNRCSVEWCEALHDFTAETKDDLSFRKGDYIQILEQVDSEWYRGRLNDKEGIFPAVFVQTCSARVETSQSLGGKKKKAQALYDFHGENEDELSFKELHFLLEVLYAYVSPSRASRMKITQSFNELQTGFLIALEGLT
ncbi:SH3 domain-containing protein 19 isoform X2 [Centrocercus urophasianus]|uniref:SH3 domain-containing protein 19 isoform X2 n=1 Tax=Centrocercus urophasianus TaxID=9002 RepID=UPI001C64BE37|nr:SH3 domain-containing protein 19 isoform X2 [Centrocercus urophasianus]XP_042684374.1 SH3 domain-containing protein 19 isoform X2 [Centrocercus urophasianus]XP_042684375.1 SH3 domain-containing protein 19 isoform X2 [Centrocercus urophasianus]XP_042684386.1 SH3 domain-containing protein 19 isoform X2 [Centrocercus urophasianus]